MRCSAATELSYVATPSSRMLNQYIRPERAIGALACFSPELSSRQSEAGTAAAGGSAAAVSCVCLWSSISVPTRHASAKYIQQDEHTTCGPEGMPTSSPQIRRNIFMFGLTFSSVPSTDDAGRLKGLYDSVVSLVLYTGA